MSVTIRATPGTLATLSPVVQPWPWQHHAIGAVRQQAVPRRHPRCFASTQGGRTGPRPVRSTFERERTF
jgi:hypothetical protein